MYPKHSLSSILAGGALLLLLPRVHGVPLDVGIAPVVDLGYAKYQGNALVSGVNEYLGMRFAASPVGDLRWRAPQDLPEDPWGAVQDATQV